MSGRALGFVAAFAIPLVLARLFDQQAFGTYKQVFLIYSTLFGIVQVGMAESLYYFLPSAANGQDTGRKASYIFNVLLVLVALGAAALLVLSTQQERIAALLNNPDLRPYLTLTGLYLVLMLASLVLEIVMTAEKQHVSASFAYALSDLGRAALLLLPVLIFGSLRALLWGAIATALVRLITTLLYLYRQFGAQLRPDRSLLNIQLRYALPFGLAGLIELIQANFHLYVVSWYFDAATFAIYAVGCLQLPITDFLMTSTSNVMMVQMREKLQAGNHAAVLAIWLDAVRKLSLLIVPMVAVLLALSHELIVFLFTTTYEASVPVFIVWTSSMVLATLLTDSLLRVHAENRFLIVQNCIRLALIAVLIQPFLHNFGLIGAVLVTACASTVAKVLALMRSKAVLKVSMAQLLPWKSLFMVCAIAAGATVPVLLLKQALPLASDTMTAMAELALFGGLYVVTYYFLLLWCGPLHDDEKQQLVRWTQLPVLRLRKAWKA